MSVLLPMNAPSLSPRGLRDRETYHNVQVSSSGLSTTSGKMQETKKLTNEESPKDKGRCSTLGLQHYAKYPFQQSNSDDWTYSSSDEESDAEDDDDKDFFDMADSDILKGCNDQDDDDNLSTTDASTVFSMLSLASNVSERSHHQGKSAPKKQGPRRRCIRFSDVPPQVFVYEKARVHERFEAFYSREELCSIMLDYYRETCLGLDKDAGKIEI